MELNYSEPSREVVCKSVQFFCVDTVLIYVNILVKSNHEIKGTPRGHFPWRY